MNKILILCLTFGLSTTIFAAKDPVVATVNGKKILKSVFEETYKQNLLFVSDKEVTKEKVLTDLINRELGINRAKGNKLDSDPVVRRKMDDIMYHAQISKDLEPKLKKIVVTDDDVKKYYEGHKEYRNAHILFRMRAQPEKKESEAALTQCLKVHNALKKNASLFAELANKYSQSSTAASGGDMGFQPSIRLAPEFLTAIKGKKQGDLIPCVRTQFGYHVVKVLAIKDYKAINTQLYKKIVYDTKRDKILDEYFAGLRKTANIQIQKKHLK
jgi:parvulin-like peptidyl-prolyl isomerase